jgi:hypothetical protein
MSGFESTAPRDGKAAEQGDHVTRLLPGTASRNAVIRSRVTTVTEWLECTAMMLERLRIATDL